LSPLILWKISSSVGKRFVTWLSKTVFPSMSTLKMPLWPSFRVAVIPYLLLMAACKLEAWGR